MFGKDTAMQLFVDKDGVHHGAVFGVRSGKLLDNVDWTLSIAPKTSI
jgi:hypothetical protein